MPVRRKVELGMSIGAYATPQYASGSLFSAKAFTPFTGTNHFVPGFGTGTRGFVNEVVGL